MKRYEIDLSVLHAGSLVIEVYESGSGEITGDLATQIGATEPEDADEVVMCEAIERVIVAHACAGIDVTAPEYVEGLITTLEAIGNL